MSTWVIFVKSRFYYRKRAPVFDHIFIQMAKILVKMLKNAQYSNIKQLKGPLNTVQSFKHIEQH